MIIALIFSLGNTITMFHSVSFLWFFLGSLVFLIPGSYLLYRSHVSGVDPAKPSAAFKIAAVCCSVGLALIASSLHAVAGVVVFFFLLDTAFTRMARPGV